MKIDLPELPSILPKMMGVESSFMGQKRRIDQWVKIQRQDIQKNLELISNPSEESDIAILLSFLRDLLVRAMRGEAGERTYQELKAAIRNKNCLQDQIYVKALEAANYRWGTESGSELISQVVGYFDGQLKWNWQHYLDKARDNKRTNFSNDYLLTIRNIGFKVRDLALSSFDPSYAAFDLHVSRVPTRIGLLNYGFELLGDPSIEMGNNPADPKNYLFLQKLFLKLADLTNNDILPVDLDRIFWHFGRTYCGSSPKCSICPIAHECLAGKFSSLNTSKISDKQPEQNRRSLTPDNNDRIDLPYGEKGAHFSMHDLADYIRSGNRHFIIIGGANRVFSEHKKPQSLDYWLRNNYTERKNTRQAVQQVTEKLIASGFFEKRNGLLCPDTGRHCMGLVLTELKQDVESKEIKRIIEGKPDISLSIKDKILSIFRDRVDEKFSRKEIIDLVVDAYPETNRNGVISSDYCYNMINAGIKFDFHIFESLNEGRYVYLGPNVPYTGYIYWKDEKVGKWEKGCYQLWKIPANDKKYNI